jgi:hypothetical protein
MSVSKKQLIANRKNAKKGGVKTEEGKAIVRHNALKHGLLSKEVVVTFGEAAERQEEFDSLLADLQDHFDPQGPLEAMLVEKIAASWWRFKRVHRCEAGLIMKGMYKAINYYDEEDVTDTKSVPRTDEEIDEEIEELKQRVQDAKSEMARYEQMRREGERLDKIYDQEDKWNALLTDWTQNHELCRPLLDWRPETIRKGLNASGLSDDDIWQAFIEQIDSVLPDDINEAIATLEREKVSNKLCGQIVKLKSSIPSTNDLDHLLRYETSIERQFYKAIDQLERIQRRRATLDVNIEKA